MIHTVEAIIDSHGHVRLLTKVHVKELRRALVTVLDEPPVVPSETAFITEAALCTDWNRPEEDVAWSHLQARE